jgi:hypothetical protein
LTALVWARGPPLTQWLERRRGAAARHGQISVRGWRVSRARSNGGSGTGTTTAAGSDAARALARTAEGAQRRILDGGFIVVGKRQFDKAVEVLKDLWVALNRGLPVLIDAALELGLRGGNFTLVRRTAVVVVGMGCQTLHVLGVGLLAALGQEAEILEDVVLGVSADPRAGDGVSHQC